MTRRHRGGRIGKYVFAGVVACATLALYSYYSVRDVLNSNALTTAEVENPVVEMQPETEIKEVQKTTHTI